MAPGTLGRRFGYIVGNNIGIEVGNTSRNKVVEMLANEKVGIANLGQVSILNLLINVIL